MTQQDNYLHDVREQYEHLPYPPRDPQDESKRLITTWLDDLPMINHYCYGGRQSFRNGFRALVAGGGTGDGTIYLAEQLRSTDAEIVHIDLSAASIAIAQHRAEVRGLRNVRWRHGSLLDLPDLDVGEFDYINCSGVLHHLADPNAGLAALLKVKKESGALGVMVYGQYGRTGIYQMQELLRLINRTTAEPGKKLATAKEVVNTLPPSNWFRRGQDLHRDHLVFGDSGVYDLLLHSQDRAYTVEEIFRWFSDGHGLHLQFTDVGKGRSSYMPDMLLGPHSPGFLADVCARPLREQYAVAELLSGALTMHSFFATQSPASAAPYGDAEQIPFFFHEPVTGPQLSALIHKSKVAPFVFNHTHTGISKAVDQGKFGKFILKYIDGKRSFADVFALVRAEDHFKRSPPGDTELFADFQPLYDFLNAIDRLLLRHPSAAG
jgi:SAM-dependent methyltransferase